MPLAACSDLSPADWIVASDVPWEQLVNFGPGGFAAYARLRFLPDPSYEGQQEHEVDQDVVPCASEQWRALFELLAAQTSDPDDCYFGLWEDWGFPESVRRWSTFSVPRVARVPARSYFLFHGPLSDAENWGTAEFSRGGEPAFVWPSDRAWCVANDVDPHWAGIGADAPLIEQLVADPRLDAVAAGLGDQHPAYR